MSTLFFVLNMFLFVYLCISLFLCFFLSSFISVLFHSSDEEWEQSKPITKEPKLSLEEVIIVTYSQLERTKYMKCRALITIRIESAPV